MGKHKTTSFKYVDPFCKAKERIRTALNPVVLHGLVKVSKPDGSVYYLDPVTRKTVA